MATRILRSRHESSKSISRRGFLKGMAAAGAALSLPSIIPAPALGANGTVAPGNRIVMGFVGVNSQGRGNLSNFIEYPEVQVVAVCDVDRQILQKAKEFVDGKYGNQACHASGDFRELTRRGDIDALCVCTPDHWHALVGLDGIRHGKDMYIEKPLTLTIREGRLLSDEARRYGRVVQTGCQQRSGWEFRKACELVRNGRIGKIQRVIVGIPGNNKTCDPTWSPMPAPEGFDYDFWVGPAPFEPYHIQRCHYTFRFILDYSGGQVTNWGAHHLDVAQWGLGMDDSGPVEVSGRGEFPRTGLFTTATNVDFDCVYANGVVLSCRTGAKGGTTFIGTEGEVHVDRGVLQTNPLSLAKDPIGANEIRLYESANHHEDFLGAVRTGRRPAADVEIGHRSATVCHLGNISMLLGRKLRWDPNTERFAGDEEANRMISRPARAPWRY